MIVYLARLLSWKHGRRKGYALASSMVDLLEANGLRPRQGYLIDLTANTVTGEVHLVYDKQYSYMNVETKVAVKSLSYTKMSPWSKYKLRPV